MEIDNPYDAQPGLPTTEMEDPYAHAADVAYVQDDEMNLDDMPVTQEDAWAVIRWVVN